MTESEPDYKPYNLEQLYDIRQRIDSQRFPARHAALLQEIARKERLSDEATVVQNYPPCALLLFFGARPSRQDYQPSLALKIVRTLVNLEFGLLALIFMLPVLAYIGLVILLIVIGFFVYALFFGGVAILNKSLNTIRDEHAIELWSLVALGISPLSAFFYTSSVALAMEQAKYYGAYSTVLLILTPLVGFYTPYVLAVFWVKYHCRDDGF